MAPKTVDEVFEDKRKEFVKVEKSVDGIHRAINKQVTSLCGKNNTTIQQPSSLSPIIHTHHIHIITSRRIRKRCRIPREGCRGHLQRQRVPHLRDLPVPRRNQQVHRGVQASIPGDPHLLLPHPRGVQAHQRARQVLQGQRPLRGRDPQAEGEGAADGPGRCQVQHGAHSLHHEQRVPQDRAHRDIQDLQGARSAKGQAHRAHKLHDIHRHGKRLRAFQRH